MRVLFIGNSHTFANAMPFMFRQMLNARLAGGNANVWSVTSGGKTLAWHAAEVGTQQAITMHQWDAIVLQQQTHPFGGYSELADGYEKLHPYLAAAGANVFLYVTWKAKLAPDADQQELNAAFARLARERGHRLAGVGDAWARARKTHPKIELYGPDDRHASPAGSYLAACTIFTAITRQSPMGLPARIVSNRHTLIELDEPTAACLQSAAEHILELSNDFRV